jgi:hypothetical protein
MTPPGSTRSSAGSRRHETAPRSTPSIQALEKDIRDRITNWNDNPKPFTWTKATDEILERLASYIQRIPGAGR